MERNTRLFSFCFALIFFFCVQNVYAVTFSRTLTIGDTGSDVLELQKILNTNSNTRIAVSGPGSPGNETNYFGPLTSSAVAKYQEVHAKDILIPLGLTRGTGFVGQATRTFLNAKGSSTVVSQSTTVQAPKITSLSPTQGGVGTVVTIHGEGFLDEDNHVVTAFEDFGDVASDDGTTLTITINGPFPKEFLKKNAEFYKKEKFTMDYEIAVINELGNSNFASFTFLFYE